MCQIGSGETLGLDEEDDWDADEDEEEDEEEEVEEGWKRPNANVNSIVYNVPENVVDSLKHNLRRNFVFYLNNLCVTYFRTVILVGAGPHPLTKRTQLKSIQ